MSRIWLLLGGMLGLSEPDPAAQQRAFQRCAACHATTPEAQELTGPSLKGVFGRRAGAVPGFAYSDALTEAGREGVVWDERTLDLFLRDPEAVYPGTTMPYQGGPASERAAVIAYLRRLR